MPKFVVQGKSADADLIARGVESLGGRVIRSLTNLERLSGAAVLIVEVPEPLTHRELEALPGVRIVEGEFFHPFYSCGGQHPPEAPQPAQLPFYLPFVTPSDAVASLLQLLPPQVYKAAVPQTLLEAITATPTAQSEALQKFDVREMPFGAPGLRLGTPATAEQFRRAGDLARILETIRAPQAQRLTLGENAVIAVVDSGIDPSKVPEANRLGGWSDTGADPWVDDTGHGCLSGDTKVYTSFCGLVTLEELYDRLEKRYGSHEGRILIPDEEPIFTIGFANGPQKARVLAVHRIPVDGKVVRVWAGRDNWLLTPWHLCLVRHPMGYYRYVRADQLRPRYALVGTTEPVDIAPEQRCLVTYNLPSHGIKTEELPINEDIAYFLGIVLADAHLVKGRSCNYIYCATQDEARKLVSAVEKATGTGSHYARYPVDTGWKVYIPMKGVALCEAVGIPFGKKAHRAFVPEIIWKSPSRVRAAFLAGLIDGDGSFGENTCRIITASDRLAHELLSFISILGVKATLSSSRTTGRIWRGHYIKGGRYWHVKVSGGYLKKLLEHVGPFLKMKRPPRVWGRRGKHSTAYITRVEQENYKGFFYDLTTDTQNYLAGSRRLVFVHNSMVAEIALAVAPKAQIISIKPGVSPAGAMSSMGTLSALDHLAGLAQELRTPIISNHSWGIFGVKNMVLPCLPSAAFVMTPRGPIPISEVKVGDIVWSFEGEGLVRKTTKVGPSGRGWDRVWRRWELDLRPVQRRVLAKEYRGIRPVLKLRTTRRAIEATPEHPFLRLTKVKTGRYILEWVPLQALREGDIILSLKCLPAGDGYRLKENPWGLKEVTPDLARLLGYLIGDGCVTNPHAVIFSEPPGPRRQFYRNLLVSLFGERKAYEREGRVPQVVPSYGESRNNLTVHSGPVSSFLASLIGGRKRSLEKRVPTWVYQLPREGQLAFLEGYADADGSYRPRGGGLIQIDSPNRELVRQLRALAIAAGMHVGNLEYLERPSIVPNGRQPRSFLQPSYMFPIYTHKANRRRRHGVDLPQKHRVYLPQLREHPYVGFERVVSIQPGLAQPVWDIEIEGSGILATELISHNCSILITRALRLLDEEGLVITSWAAGNNGAFGQFPNLYCMNSTKWSVSTGALDRLLRPHFYTSRGFGQCYPFQPTVSTVTYGILPWGAGYMDFGEQGAGTSSCAPQTSGALALMLSFYGPKPFRDLRAALRAGANNAILGFPGLPYHPATGAGLLQVDAALAAVPRAAAHPSWLAEATIPSNIPRLGEEPELAA
jgi:intein/homing endonuclease